MCPQYSFPLYPEDYAGSSDDDDDLQNIIVKRSNSLGIPLRNKISVMLDKPPKKVVRFADMLVCFVFRIRSIENYRLYDLFIQK